MNLQNNYQCFLRVDSVEEAEIANTVPVYCAQIAFQTLYIRSEIRIDPQPGVNVLFDTGII